MADQAATLRLLASRRDEPSAHHRPERIVAIGSGKGGVGKSNVSLNLAIELSVRGNSVCLIDADLGMANIGILAGVSPRYTLTHHLERGVPVEEILVDGPGGVKILPGSHGSGRMADLTAEQRDRLGRSFSLLPRPFDFLVVDVGAGISQNVTGFMERADDAMIVVTPEPTSMADAYGLIKVLAGRSCRAALSLVVNRAASITQAKGTADRIRALSMEYLEQPVSWAGFLLEDKTVSAAVLSRRPFTVTSRHSHASRSVALIADRLIRSGDAADEYRERREPARSWFSRIFA